MLYRTHHPLFFQFHPFPSPSPSLTLAPPNPPLSSLLQVEPEMECVEAALKTSFRKDMGLKSSNHQVFLDDLCAVNAQNVVSCDDFFVDDLLDLSNDDAFVEKETNPEHERDGVEDEPETKKLGSVSVSVSLLQRKQQEEEKLDENDANLLSKDDLGALPATELSVPAEDLASLEWLSHFVEDSFSEFSAAPFLTGVTPERPMKMIEVVQPKQEAPFKTPVPAKARSKRTRTGGRVWSLGSPSLTESSSSSTTSSSSCSSPSSPWLIYAHPSLSMDPVYSVENRPGKKQRKAGTEAMGAPPRRCSHCGVQKTPQWRTGPLGAKTLCNACGVRFKSGRLLPEYRPACSPTFSSELHSNHHRKVLEMRRKKETLPRPDSGLGPQPVPSF